MNATSPICSIRVLVVALACSACCSTGVAGVIGVQYQGSGMGLTASETAGLVPQTNFNVITGFDNSSPISLNDSTGLPSGASVTDTTAGDYGNQNSPAPYTGANPNTYDETLNSGLVNGNGAHSFTISNIPYAAYDLIIYELDNNARTEGTAINGVASISNPDTVWLEGPATSTSAGYADGNPATPYTYIQGNSSDPDNPTAGGDFVEFDNLVGNSVTFSVVAPSGLLGDGNGNVFVSGFQIVSAVPEPSSIVLGMIGAAAILWMGVRHRREVCPFAP